VVSSEAVPNSFPTNTVADEDLWVHVLTGPFVKLRCGFYPGSKHSKCTTRITSGAARRTPLLEPYGETPMISYVRVGADFVAKVENRTPPENRAKGDFQSAVTLRSPISPLRGSVVVFPRNDVVPHLATSYTRQRP
jgi:ribosomal protein L14